MVSSVSDIAAVAKGAPLSRFWARQDAHSLFVAAAGLLFAATLVIDLVLQRPGLSAWVLWALLAFCLSLAATAAILGRRFPIAVGLCCVVTFVLASVYFLSPWGDVQSTVSSAQELPILALYLGWFVPRPLGRIVMLSATALIVAATAINPLFRPDGGLGAPTAVQMVVIALFCFEIGSRLWRRSERRLTTDPLTGALNRAGFLDRLGREIARSQRSGTPLSLVVIDFDRFKELNDTRGHAAGDRALVETVGVWRDGIRSSDAIGRTGGDEFAILLDRTDAAGAQRIAGRLRAASSHSWSWGVAQVRGDDDAEAVFARADRILYESKRGRP